jgi:phosphoribosylformylglycinamidine cyclo-ligase
MPGFYADGEYDLAGFIVGVVERRRVVDGRRLLPGDVLLALPSTGLHTNGYSLARTIVFDVLGLRVDSFVAELGTTVGDALLAPHRAYLPALRALLAEGRLKGMAHITGGGITDNLPRILPPGTAARVDRSSWSVLPIFRWLVEAGGVPREEAYRTFNMGVGMILAVASADAGRIEGALAAAGESGAIRIGEIVAGDGEVVYTD